MVINVLGTPYTLQEVDAGEDPKIDGTRDGYTDTSVKYCVIDSMKDESPANKENLAEYKKGVIRHELIHAFLFEYGLDAASWAMNEEMVDWFALQAPKLMKAFEEAGAT